MPSWRHRQRLTVFVWNLALALLYAVVCGCSSLEATEGLASADATTGEPRPWTQGVPGASGGIGGGDTTDGRLADLQPDHHQNISERETAALLDVDKTLTHPVPFSSSSSPSSASKAPPLPTLSSSLATTSASPSSPSTRLTRLSFSDLQQMSLLPGAGGGPGAFSSFSCCHDVPELCGPDGRCTLGVTDCVNFCICTQSPSFPWCQEELQRLRRMLERTKARTAGTTISSSGGDPLGQSRLPDLGTAGLSAGGVVNVLGGAAGSDLTSMSLGSLLSGHLDFDSHHDNALAPPALHVSPTDAAFGRPRPRSDEAGNAKNDGSLPADPVTQPQAALQGKFPREVGGALEAPVGASSVTTSSGVSGAVHRNASSVTSPLHDLGGLLQSMVGGNSSTTTTTTNNNNNNSTRDDIRQSPGNPPPSWFESRNPPSHNSDPDLDPALDADHSEPSCDSQCLATGGRCVFEMNGNYNQVCVYDSSDPCSNFLCEHGACVTSNGSLSCQCQAGWAGTFCNKVCELDCGEHGSCLVLAIGEPGCKCHGDYTGLRCDELKPTAYPLIGGDQDGEASAVWQIAAGVVGLGTGLLALSVLVGYLSWRRQWLPIRRLVYYFQQYEDDDEKEYDAFVSYRSASSDEQFVLHELYPHLERHLDFKLCMHFRDFPPGETIANNIMQAIENSRRTILVLSPSYVQSEWCRLEYQKAQHEMLKLKHKIIPVMLEDISDHKSLDRNLRSILDTVTYIRWPGCCSCSSSSSSSGSSSATSESGSFGPSANFAMDSASTKGVDKFWKLLQLSMPKRKSECSRSLGSTGSCSSDRPLTSSGSNSCETAVSSSCFSQVVSSMTSSASSFSLRGTLGKKRVRLQTQRSLSITSSLDIEAEEAEEKKEKDLDVDVNGDNECVKVGMREEVEMEVKETADEAQREKLCLGKTGCNVSGTGRKEKTVSFSDSSRDDDSGSDEGRCSSDSDRSCDSECKDRSSSVGSDPSSDASDNLLPRWDQPSTYGGPPRSPALPPPPSTPLRPPRRSRGDSPHHVTSDDHIVEIREVPGNNVIITPWLPARLSTVTHC